MDERWKHFRQFDELVLLFFLARAEDMALINKEIETLKRQIALLERNQALIHLELQVLREKYEKCKEQLQQIFNTSMQSGKIVPSDRRYIEVEPE